MLTVLKSGVKLITRAKFGKKKKSIFILLLHFLVFHAHIIIKNTFDFDEIELFSSSLYSQ